MMGGRTRWGQLIPPPPPKRMNMIRLEIGMEVCEFNTTVALSDEEKRKVSEIMMAQLVGATAP